ncbi:MAG TPA: hypothetical protein VHN11_15220, partial [Xanthobacteraceae bacterium]|nr:hypothetical protein [Xanthobacteraceae bacterium]
RSILLSMAIMCALALPAAAQDESGGAAPQSMPQGAMGGPNMGGPSMMQGRGEPGLPRRPTIDPQAIMGMMTDASNMMSMVTIGFLTSADTNHDGNVSRDEWGKLFDKLDPDHDGTITKAELDKMRKDQIDRMQQMRAQMMQHMQGMNAPTAGTPNGSGMDEPPPAPAPQAAPAQ